MVNDLVKRGKLNNTLYLKCIHDVDAVQAAIADEK